ncbi:MAG TPA: hypothetical protein VGR63_15260 [Casimicrobiaceae bacterium]|jgi:hypothetical protein|nr:hypothetical protein [Casimicrobiaceae bacterium]
MAEDKKQTEAQRKSEQEAAHAAAARQEEQSRPGPGERRYSPSPQDRSEIGRDPGARPGVVPTGGPLVFQEGGEIGQNPYTDPPTMAHRRFYEDPMPRGEASEQQVLQGRGAPAPYPTEALDRPWAPRRFPDQLETMRPNDTPQPGWIEANGALTLAQFAALPRQEQDRILGEMRNASIGRPPEYQPTRVSIEEEDRRTAELERVRREADRDRREREGERLSMAPAAPGTVTAGEGPAAA